MSAYLCSIGVGRTYDPTPVAPSPSGRTMHPSAQPQPFYHPSASPSQSPSRIRRPATPCAVPGLIPDESSSDDSDGLISPPPERVGSTFGYMGAVLESTPSCDYDDDRAMLFAAAARARTGASPPKVKSSRRSSRELRLTSSGFGSSDEGCLGGF